MLGAHDVIGPSVRLPCDDSDLRDSGFCVGKEKLGSVADDTIVLLMGTCGRGRERV